MNEHGINKKVNSAATQQERPGSKYLDVNVRRAQQLILTILWMSLFWGCSSPDPQTPASTPSTTPTASPSPTPTPAATPSPPPTPSPSPTPIKNVIVVIMQNRSFDHLFGTFPGVNGIAPGVAGFSQHDAAGNTVTPFLLTDTAPADLSHSRSTLLLEWDHGKMDQYAFVNGDNAMGHYDQTTPGMAVLWNWASHFALADNFFPSAMSDAPTNQLYLVAADDDNNPNEIQPFYPPCNMQVTAQQPYTFAHVGDEMVKAGLSWTWYAGNLNQCGNGYVSQENPFQFFTDTHASSHVQDLSQFSIDLAAGQLPALVMVQPGAGRDMHPAAGIPVSAGTTWLNDFILEVQASSIWTSAAIIVIWDSSGGWWDHVPPPQVDSQGYGARVPMLVISPFSKSNYVSHVQMDDVSILNFIQETFGLTSLNARNQLSGDLHDMFTF